MLAVATRLAVDTKVVVAMELWVETQVEVLKIARELH